MKLVKIIIASLLLVLVSNVSAEEKEMTYDMYLVELKKEQDREAAAKQQITQLEQEIAAIQGDIETTKSQVESLWREMLEFVGITQEDFDAFVTKIDDLLSKIQGFESEYAEDFKGWKQAIVDAEVEVTEIKEDKIAIFPRLDGKITALDEAIADSKAALEAAIEAARGDNSTYTVRLIPERRDCLWRIAENDEIYGDAWKWPAIYSANKDQIKDPDLIFPGQELVIPAQ